MGAALLSHHHEGIRQFTARFLCNLAHDHSAAHPWLMQLLINSMALADSKHHYCGCFYEVFAAVVKEMGRQTPEVNRGTTSTGQSMCMMMHNQLSCRFHCVWFSASSICLHRNHSDCCSGLHMYACAVCRQADMCRKQWARSLTSLAALL